MAEEKESSPAEITAAEQEQPEAEVNYDSIPTCCRRKTRERSMKEYRDLVNRLSRIEGQVRGIRRMLDQNVYCLDIITQVGAVDAALNSFNKVLLADHVRTCVADDLREGNEAELEKLVQILPKLMK